MSSKSLWKSVVVKSLRMGWPAGLDAALTALSPSAVKGLLWSGVFEDVFPLPTEIQAVGREIDALDFEALCVRETHHGQGLAGAFCDLADVATRHGAQEYGRLYAIAKGQGAKLAPQCAHLFYTWLELAGKIVGGRRSLDRTPFRGIPLAMVDLHTCEGRQQGRGATILSGTYAGHRRLGQSVRAYGWGRVRSEVHAERTIGTQVQLSMEACMAR